mgnify:CR=1 FL=1
MKGQPLRRKTDKCGVKPKKVTFGKDFHKSFAEAADRISVRSGGMTGKQWFRSFKANNYTKET